MGRTDRFYIALFLFKTNTDFLSLDLTMKVPRMKILPYFARPRLEVNQLPLNICHAISTKISYTLKQVSPKIRCITRLSHWS